MKSRDPRLYIVEDGTANSHRQNHVHITARKSKDDVNVTRKDVVILSNVSKG